MKVTELAELLALPDLPASLAKVEVALDAAVDRQPPNPYLVDPARRVVKGGGKRLRPVLAIATAASCGSDLTSDVVAGAVAVELVHVGSLVHDDIIDNAAERRGVATVNSREGDAAAILVGDFLLAQAGERAASISREVASALAMTIASLCDGQSRETLDLYDAHRSVDRFLASIGGKTAALLQSSCRIGSLAAHHTDAQVSALSDFGHAFGMAFQIVDDVLDLVSTSTLMGKPVGNDIRQGVYTLPLLLAFDTAGGDAVRQRLVDRGRGPIDESVLDEIVGFVRSSGAIDQSLALARQYNERAARALSALEPNPVVEGLARLPEAYLQWALDTKAGAPIS
jgi:heptaprenyl diphosphate synthase/octaprenyl-diphosphate synthase